MTSRLENPQAMIQRIQAGDDELREQFITVNVPFIKRVVRHITHLFFVEQADEFSIALEAYNEAIDHYKVDGEVPFEPYARLLIKNRLFDWMRRQKHVQGHLSLSDSDSDDGLNLAERLADPKSDHVQQDLEFAESMDHLQLQLQLFGLNLTRMINTFPKHQDSRLLCIRIARQLSGDNALYIKFMQTRRLPCAELSRRCSIPLKTIEKNRSSVILLTLLLHSELQVIQSYIAAFERKDSK